VHSEKMELQVCKDYLDRLERQEYQVFKVSQVLRENLEMGDMETQELLASLV